MILQSLKNTLKAFNVYIQGGSYETLDHFFATYDTRLQDLNTEFMLTTINNPEIVPYIRQILTSLDVTEEQIKNDIQSQLSVYEFFLELSRKGHIQMTYIIELIHQKTRISKWTLLLGALISTTVAAGVGASVLFIPALSEVLLLLKQFLASSTGLPALGLVKAVVTLAFFAWQILSDDKQPLFDRIRDSSFLFVNSFMLILGNIIWIASASPMTPLVAILFVASPAMDVVKELFCLSQEYYHYRNIASTPNKDSLSDVRSYIRHENGFNKHLYAALINLAVAVAVVGIMAAWCFIPGGLVISVAAIASLALVHGTKYLALSLNEDIMRDHLQDELRDAKMKHKASALSKTSTDVPHVEYKPGTLKPRASSWPFFKAEDLVDNDIQGSHVASLDLFRNHSI